MNRITLYTALILSIFTSCRQASTTLPDGGDTLTAASSLLTLVDFGDYVVADIANPWSGDGNSTLQRLVIAPRDYAGALPEGTVVRTPIERSVVYSGVHGGAIDELGAVNAIAGVADGQYFSTPSIVNAIKSGKIKDVGNSMSPSQEMIVDIDPGAILLSPYQDQDLGAVDKLGIPVVQLVDYMEATPLGRAEWIKLLGVIYDRRTQADSIYNNVCENYRALVDMARSAESRPVVITEQPMPGGTWDVPRGGSYMARMLQDAGAFYPWASTEGSGSLHLDAARVLDQAQDADYWLIRNYGPLSLSALGMGNPLSSHFKAFKNGSVYVCDTSQSPLFDEFPFHPDRLLRDYILLFHPGLLPDQSPRYYVTIADI